jgi:hypothetical protein
VSELYEQDPPGEAIVKAYLANRLDSTHAEAFELYCLRHPEFARRVELDLIFKMGLKHMPGPDRAQVTGAQRRRVFAMAAGLVLLAGGGLLLLARLHAGALVAYRSVTEVPSALLSGARVSLTLIRLRDRSGVHRVVAPRQAGVLAVRVAPDSSPGVAGYAMRVALESGLNPRSVTLDNLRPDANGYLETYLPLAALAGQSLRIAVTPSPPTGAQPVSFQVQVDYAPN